MDPKQKRVLKKIVMVAIFTTVMAVSLMTLKDYINKSEAMRAMDLVSREALAYRKSYGSLPSESNITKFLDRIQAVRLGNFNYRAMWIEYGSNADTTILAYSKKNYKWPLRPGYITLWLNGKTQWLTAEQFEPILQNQQNKIEMDVLQQQLKQHRR